ncbi:MAG: lipoprotein Spr [Bacteroidia bacterium]|jgi:lipoprotein Spr
MRNLLIILCFILTNGLLAQDTTKVILEEVDTSATNPIKWKKIRKICSELSIPANPEANLELLMFTLDWQGTPYCYGGNTKKCTDCSGFTSNAYNKVYNKIIPRVSREIYNNSMPIDKRSLYEGDLVFFATGGGKRITHVGIYLWDGYFAHASSSKGVMVSNLRQGYYRKTYVGGGAWID